MPQQRRHELEGAPDPFPSLVDDTPVKARRPATNGAVDTDSQEAFPSLAPAPQPAKPVASAWGAGAGPRIKPVASKQPVVSDTFVLSSIDLSAAGKDGKPTTLGDVARQVMAQYKVKLDASTNQRSRQTTFYLKADTRKELDKAKRSLLALLSPVVRDLARCFPSFPSAWIRAPFTGCAWRNMVRRHARRDDTVIMRRIEVPGSRQLRMDYVLVERIWRSRSAHLGGQFPVFRFSSSLSAIFEP